MPDGDPTPETRLAEVIAKAELTKRQVMAEGIAETPEAWDDVFKRVWGTNIKGFIAGGYEAAVGAGYDVWTSVITGAVSSRVDPLADALAAWKGTGLVSAEVDGLFKVLNVGDSFAGWIMDIMSWVAMLGNMVSAQYAPVMSLLNYTYQARVPVEPFPLDIANRLSYRGQISADDLFKAYRWRGLSEGRQNAIVRAGRPPLDLGTLHEMERRGMLVGPHRDESMPGVPLLPVGADASVPLDFATGLDYLGFEWGTRAALQELAWVVPGVNDQIRFAVREAFDDPYALKYGTDSRFDDLPLRLMERSGISRDWIKLYWRSHWELPSIQMGFQMLHRRAADPTETVISEGELDDLMYALDIMPWWRDKLKSISYNPFTRVDVRRMHKIGVLDDEAVYYAYRDLGFDDAKALKMWEFTVDYNQEGERDATKTEILRWAKAGVMRDEDAVDLLVKLGYREDIVSWHMQFLQAQRDADVVERRIKLAERRYKKRLADGTETSISLYQVGLEQPEVQYLLDLWTPDRTAEDEDKDTTTAPEPRRPTLTQLRKMVEVDPQILTLDDWRKEMVGRRFSVVDTDRLAELYFPVLVAEETAEV